MSGIDIALVGTSGLARELLGYLEDDPRYRVVCALDDNPDAVLPGYEVVSPSDWDDRCGKAIFSVGYPEYKRDVLARYMQLGFEWQTYVHPKALVSKQARIGHGCIIGPFAVIAGNAMIGNFVFLNVYAAVGHDAVIGDFSSLMPYACVEGYACLGQETLAATGAKVLPQTQVGDRSRISAGAVVMRDMPSDMLIHGNPAKAQPDIAMLRKKKE